MIDTPTPTEAKFLMLVDSTLQPIVVARDHVTAIGLPAAGATGSVLLFDNGLQIAIALNQIDAMNRLNDPGDAVPPSPLLAPLN